VGGKDPDSICRREKFQDAMVLVIKEDALWGSKPHSEHFKGGKGAPSEKMRRGRAHLRGPSPEKKACEPEKKSFRKNG